MNFEKLSVCPLTYVTIVAQVVLVAAIGGSTGCYAPLHSPGIPASSLPDSFRIPYRSVGQPLNFAELTLPPPTDYRLGPNDVLQVSVPELYSGAEIRPMQVQVMSTGEIHLPLVGPVRVGGLNLLEAQQVITERYADGVLQNPSVNVSLGATSTVDVLVLGEVNEPGVHALPRFQNDVGHAIAAAGGMTREAADTIEVHRKRPPQERMRLGMPETLLPPESPDAPDAADPPAVMDTLPPPVDEMTMLGENCPPSFHEAVASAGGGQQSVLRIPLRGLEPGFLTQDDITLRSGDVVVIPSRRNEVFWVVGELSQTNLVRFTLGDRERELGTGLVIPPDRDIDVVTAVAMAGYIDPIDSPTTVTVHRTRPDGTPLLIRVDLIAARYDRRETIMVRPGDIIYVNPDAAWWFRRTFDRVIPDLILFPYAELVLKVFGRRG